MGEGELTGRGGKGGQGEGAIRSRGVRVDWEVREGGRSWRGDELYARGVVSEGKEKGNHRKWEVRWGAGGGKGKGGRGVVRYGGGREVEETDLRNGGEKRERVNREPGDVGRG